MPKRPGFEEDEDDDEEEPEPVLPVLPEEEVPNWIALPPIAVESVTSEAPPASVPPCGDTKKLFTIVAAWVSRSSRVPIITKATKKTVRWITFVLESLRRKEIIMTLRLRRSVIMTLHH